MSCVGWREGLPGREASVRVCQFNAPGAVAVTTPAGTTVYQTGTAQPATVTIRNGQPVCALAGWFDPALGRN